MGFGFIRLHYLLLFALTGAYMPYLPIYLHSLGLRDGEIGRVLSVYGVAMIFTPILAGHLADRRLSNRGLLALCNLGVAAGLGGLCLIAGGVYLVFLLIAIFSIAFTPMFSLIGGLTFAAMHDEESAGRTPPPYHRLRLWGSLGFLLPGIALWPLLRYTDLTERAAIVAAAAIGLCSAFLVLGLPRPSRAGEGEPELPRGSTWRAISGPPARTAVGSMILMFTALAIFYTFYPRYLQEVGFDRQRIGLIVNIGVVVEIGCILIGGWFVHKFGFRGAMLLGAACMVLRFGLLALFPNMGVAIGSQLLHGPVVMVLYVLAPMYLNHKAGRANRNAMQGLYSVLCFGLARVAGSLAGGQAADWGGDDALRGLQGAFGVGTVLCVIAAIWLALRFRDEPAEHRLRHSVRPSPHPAAPET